MVGTIKNKRIYCIIGWNPYIFVIGLLKLFRWSHALRINQPTNLGSSLGIPSTLVVIFWCMCLQTNILTSPPSPQKSYSKIRNPRTTFENNPLFQPKPGPAEACQMDCTFVHNGTLL